MKIALTLFWGGMIFMGLQAHAVKYKGRLVPGDWDIPWTQTLVADLQASPLIHHTEKQIETLCPGYTKYADKRMLFWQQLMVSLSWKESMHGPENYVEFGGATNDGLFQIDPRLRTAYGCKDFVLFDPLANIKCAVKMATKLVKRYGSFLSGSKEGMAAYWQPLRASSNLNRKNRAAILAEVKTACKSGKIVYRCNPVTAGDSGSHIMHDTGGDMDEMDLSFNTLEDLGLRPDEIEPTMDLKAYPAVNFEMDPASLLLKPL